MKAFCCGVKLGIRLQEENCSFRPWADSFNMCRMEVLHLYMQKWEKQFFVLLCLSWMVGSVGVGTKAQILFFSCFHSLVISDPLTNCPSHLDHCFSLHCCCFYTWEFLARSWEVSVSSLRSLLQTLLSRSTLELMCAFWLFEELDLVGLCLVFSYLSLRWPFVCSDSQFSYGLTLYC